MTGGARDPLPAASRPNPPFKLVLTGKTRAALGSWSEGAFLFG